MQQYRYDVHVHTAQSSLCSQLDAHKMVELYARAGYAGIITMDHLHEEFIGALGSQTDWGSCVDALLLGYREAKAAGDALGLDVLWGIEIRFPQSVADYLLYGMDEALLRQHPYMHRTTIEEFYERFGKEVLIVQAHPYRAFTPPCKTQAIHGVEVINAHPRHEDHNEKALALALEHPQLLRTCGSDAHREGDEARTAMLLSQRIKSTAHYAQQLREGRAQLWSPVYADIAQAANRTQQERERHVF